MVVSTGCYKCYFQIFKVDLMYMFKFFKFNIQYLENPEITSNYGLLIATLLSNWMKNFQIFPLVAISRTMTHHFL